MERLFTSKKYDGSSDVWSNYDTKVQIIKSKFKSVYYTKNEVFH